MAVNLVQPGGTRIAHKQAIGSKDVVQNVRIIGQVLMQTEYQLQAFRHVPQNFEIQQLFLKIAFFDASLSHFLHKSVCCNHLEIGIRQEKEQVVGFQVVVNIPYATGERTLAAKTLQFID